MKITELHTAITEHTKAACALAVVEATAPRDAPRVNRAKAELTTASTALYTALLDYEYMIRTEVSDTYWQHLQQCHPERLDKEQS